MATESEIISMMRRRARSTGGVVLGIGDDAAVLQTEEGKDVLACCDLLVEGVHFRRQWGVPRLIGRKALAVNLSDIAAMGGVAKYAMISIALPPGSFGEFDESLVAGIFELADASGVSIIGGDTSSSPGPLFIDVSVIGECESGRAVTRAGAKPGDLVCVTGSLGSSALGLKLIEESLGGARKEKRTVGTLRELIDGLIRPGMAIQEHFSRMGPRSFAEAVEKHLKPEPRLAFGAAVGSRQLATAMIDISDGLSTDLGHILDESKCGAIVDADSIPIADCVLHSSLPAEKRIEPLYLALHGGEEYELLFTCRPENEAGVEATAREAGLRVTAIGEIVAEPGLMLKQCGETRALERGGYQHQIT